MTTKTIGAVAIIGSVFAAGVAVGQQQQSTTRREPQFENSEVQVWKSIINPGKPLGNPNTGSPADSNGANNTSSLSVPITASPVPATEPEESTSSMVIFPMSSRAVASITSVPAPRVWNVR